jgi:hypothetical protein
VRRILIIPVTARINPVSAPIRAVICPISDWSVGVGIDSTSGGEGDSLTDGEVPVPGPGWAVVGELVVWDAVEFGGVDSSPGVVRGVVAWDAVESAGGELSPASAVRKTSDPTATSMMATPAIRSRRPDRRRSVGSCAMTASSSRACRKTPAFRYGHAFGRG